jgi:hypothetical protein
VLSFFTAAYLAEAVRSHLAPVVVRRRKRAEVALHGSAHFAVR